MENAWRRCVPVSVCARHEREKRAAEKHDKKKDGQKEIGGVKVMEQGEKCVNG